MCTLITTTYNLLTRARDTNRDGSRPRESRDRATAKNTRNRIPFRPLPPFLSSRTRIPPRVPVVIAISLRMRSGRSERNPQARSSESFFPRYNVIRARPPPLYSRYSNSRGMSEPTCRLPVCGADSRRRRSLRRNENIIHPRPQLLTRSRARARSRFSAIQPRTLLRRHFCRCHRPVN